MRAHRSLPGKSSLWLKTAVSLAAALLLGEAGAYTRLLLGGDVNIRLADFVTYVSAGQLVLDGRGGSIYDYSVISRVQSRLTYPLHMPGGVSPFLYPPWFGLLSAFSALFPYRPAYALWLLCNLVFALLALFALAHYTGVRGLQAALFILLGLSSLPVFAALGHGQVSILLLMLLVAAVWMLRNEHEIVAGTLLALVLIKPQYALPVAGVFLLQRRWSAVTSFAVCAALLVALPLPILGGGIERAYVTSLIHLSTTHGTAGYMAPPAINYSLEGATTLLFSNPWASIARIGLSIAALGMAAWIAYSRPLDDRALALGVLCGLLVSPHVLVYDVSLAIFTVGILLRHAKSFLWLGLLLYVAPLLGLLMHHAVLLTVAALLLTLGITCASTINSRSVAVAIYSPKRG